MEKNTKLEREIKQLQATLKQVENERDEYIQKFNESAEECKERKLELIQAKRELKELRRLKSDPKDYLNWSGDDIIDYLSMLEDGKYERYSAKLRVIFVEEAVSGKALPYIDNSTLRDWGISNFMDRTNIFNHFQNIVNQNNVNVNNNNNDNNNGNNAQDEGKIAQTAWIG